ncbi:uncharacterized protein B0H64DRAFT_340878, partial [Chaetomium fimeti]
MLSHNEAFSTQDYDSTSLELFYPLNDVTRNVKADIILVPGLGGDYIGTWKADDEFETVWPKDLLPLPNYIPGVRVLSFRYNTSLNGTTSDAGIRDHANDLLVWLYNDREDDESASLRPLVFVGHSLGGIIVKSALTKMAHDNKYQNLWDASRGVMFFATPHFGLNKDKWLQFAYRVLLRRAPSKGVVPTENMLDELKVNSGILDRVSEDFLPLQPELSFVTFVENTPMKGMEELMVDRVYGLTRTPTEFPRRLSGDHIGLCQFKNHDDDLGEFELVQDGIRSLINDEPRAVHRLKYQEKRALYSLCPTSFHCHSRDTNPTKETCGWIFKTQEMERWLINDSGKEKLWISGPAGCGKSFLAQHIITKLHEGKSSTQHGVVHCSLSDSHPSRGNLEALLRATLHQALHHVPELVTTFLLPTFEEAQIREHDEQEIWTRHVLITIWADAMAEVMARRPLSFVIDGLDEISKECQDTFFDCLGKLPQKTRAAFERLKRGPGEPHPPKMKLLALSRGDEDIRERLGRLGFKSYDVQPKDTKEDIKKTVWAGMSSLWKARGRNTDAPSQRICNKIADDSNGSYLWSSLVVEILRRGRMTSEKQILFLLERYVPGDVDDLYSHILLGLNQNPRSSTFVKQVLQWAIFQQEGLKLSEFTIANALAKATAQHPHQTITPEILASCLDDNIKLRVEFHCGHLVKFQDDGRLSLIHRTLKHHLTKHLHTDLNPLSSSNPSPSSPDAGFFLDPKTTHASLANLCIAYLTMPCFDISTPPSTPLTSPSFESRLRHRIKTHPFLRYAALHWHKHLALAGEAWPGSQQAESMLTRRAWLVDGASGYGQCWTEVWWFFVRGVAQDFPVGGELAGRVVEAALGSVAASASDSAPAVEVGVE